MKKILSIILVLAICLCFTGCGNNGGASSSDGGFVKPAGYVSVIQISINPTVNLYLDGQDNILAVEYVNDDAKESYQKIESRLVGSSIAEGVKLVVETAEQDGFLDGGEVKVDIIDSSSQSAEQTVLLAAAVAVKQTLEQNGIDAELKVLKEGESVDPSDELWQDVLGKDDVSSNPSADNTSSDTTSRPSQNTSSGSVSSAPNPNQKLRLGEEYIAMRQWVATGVIYRTKIVFTENGYSYSTKEFSTERYDQSAESFVFAGVTYWDSAAKGGGGEYTVSENVITCIDEGVQLEINQNGDLVLLGNGFDMFVDGIFSIPEH